MLFGDRIYSDGHASAVRLLCPTITATLQQSIHCAPLLWPHFSSPFIVPHYYGRTPPVHSLCPTITAALHQSIHCAPLLQPHSSSPFIVPHSTSPFIVPHYYGHTSPVHSLCPTIMAALQQSIHCAPLIQHHISSPASFSHSFDHTPRIQLWCSPVTSTPAAQSGSQYYGYKSSLQLLSPSIKATHRQPSFSLPLLWSHQQSGHGAPLLWSHRLSSQATAIMAAHYQCGHSPLTHCLTYWYGNLLEYLEVWSWLCS